jgi:MFS transporter, FHS family, L-fucose permease
MSVTKTTASKNYIYQITIIGLLFAVFGFVTWLNGTLIPFLKKSCELSDQQAFYVATAFFAAYFFLAIPSSWILNKLGTKNGMAVGLVIMAIGCLVFVFAGSQRSYPLFLTGLFIVGMGLALLQTASNPYVSIIGPIESAATRISIMGICNKLAGMAANLMFGSLLLGNATIIQKQIDEATDPSVKTQLLNDLASRVEMPYIILAVFLVIVAAVIKFSSLPDIKEQTNESNDTNFNSDLTLLDDLKGNENSGGFVSGETAMTIGKTSVFQFPHVLLGALAIFMYVGAEVMAGDVIGIYGKNLGFSDDTSKYFTFFGLGGLLLGYVTNIALIPKYIKQEQWLTVCAILGIVMTIASYFTTGYTTVACIVALGFANAIMWPAIFPLGIRDLGRFTNMGSALLIMGIVGGAIIPPLYGWLYHEGNPFGLDFRSAFLLVMIICYIYILWFGRTGHKAGFPK